MTTAKMKFLKVCYMKLLFSEGLTIGGGEGRWGGWPNFWLNVFSQNSFKGYLHLFI